MGITEFCVKTGDQNIKKIGEVMVKFVISF